MLLYLYAIPTAILVATYLIYSLSGRGFSEYTGRLSTKVMTLERLSNIVFTKDMLTLFLKNSSINTQMYFTERELAEEKGEKAKADDSPLMSMKDMTTLEMSLKNALQPSRDLERLNHDSSLVRKLMIVFGVLVAGTEYALVSATLFAFTDKVIFQLDGIVFGVAIIFAALFLIILADMFATSRKINTAYDNVELNYRKGKDSRQQEQSSYR